MTIHDTAAYPAPHPQTLMAAEANHVTQLLDEAYQNPSADNLDKLNHAFTAWQLNRSHRPQRLRPKTQQRFTPTTLPSPNDRGPSKADEARIIQLFDDALATLDAPAHTPGDLVRRFDRYADKMAHCLHQMSQPPFVKA